MDEKSSHYNIIESRSFKSKRIVRLPLSAETFSFADEFDYAYMLKTDVESMLGHNIHIQMLTDSKSLFDVLPKNSTTTEKRLMIDIAAAREAYKQFEISDIGHIRSE